MSIFEKKPKIYHIEIKDENINKALAKLIKELEKLIDSVKKAVTDKNIDAKQEFTQEMEQLLDRLKLKIKDLQTDIQRIKNIELQEKDYISVHDNNFLSDKEHQIQGLLEYIDEFKELIESNPSIRELEDESLLTMKEELENISSALKSIIYDDESLNEIYKKILEL